MHSASNLRELPFRIPWSFANSMSLSNRSRNFSAQVVEVRRGFLSGLVSPHQFIKKLLLVRDKLRLSKRDPGPAHGINCCLTASAAA
jgi:hypothetical protein